MASRQEAARRPAPRLYLVTDTVDDPEVLGSALERALAAADCAAVLLRLPGNDEGRAIGLVNVVGPRVQARGAALLLDGHPHLAVQTGADGVHLSGWPAFAAAADRLQPARIAGAGGLRTRHDAMLAGDAGADYVMFGEPDASGRRPAFDAVIERLGWWSELFEVPCVGYAAALEEVAALAAAGADFVALGDFMWKDARGPADVVASAAGRLQSLELV